MEGILIVALCVSLVWLFRERVRGQLAMREKQYYFGQLEIMTMQYEESRRFRHDYINQMIVIEQMLIEGKQDCVQRYVGLVVQKLQQCSIYSVCGYVAIDSVINYKLSYASKQGVNVKADIVLPKDMAVDEDDVVVILGNLLDNAIEATTRLEENRYICIDMYWDKGVLFIHVENSYDAVVYKCQDTYFTRKQDTHMHGIGLQSVSATVKKYHGLLEIGNKEECFVVDVLLYL